MLHYFLKCGQDFAEDRIKKYWHSASMNKHVFLVSDISQSLVFGRGVPTYFELATASSKQRFKEKEIIFITAYYISKPCLENKLLEYLQIFEGKVRNYFYFM